MPDSNSSVSSVATPRHWWFEPQPPGTLEGYVLIIFGTICSLWAIVVVGLLGMLAGESLLMATIYALPACLLVMVCLAVRLVWLGSSRLPIVPAALGVGYVAGGAAFDLYATVLHSPLLQREGNPVARALLDSGHSLTFVYDYAFSAQLLLVLTVSLLWIGFLRHRDRIVELTGRHDSLWDFLKAATGGGHLTWRQWIVPKGPSEFPHPYHLFWILALVFVAGAIDRWFVALDWFGLVPPIRMWVLGVTLTLAPTAYLVWLRRATRRLASERPA